MPRVTRTKQLIFASLTVSAAIIAAYGTQYLTTRSHNPPSAADVATRSQLEALKGGERRRLSDLPSIGGHSPVCIIDGYSVRSGNMEEASLARIFGKIDYREHRNEIVKRYSNFAPIGFYAVSDNRLTYPIDVYLPPKTYFKFARISEVTEPRYFLSGCFLASDICIWKADQDPAGEQPILIGYCNKNHKGEI